MTLSWLEVSGNRIVDSEGHDVVLKGVNIADPEHIVRERPRVTIDGVVGKASDLGCKVVRIPVGPEDFYGHEFGFLRDKEHYFTDYLEPAVEACLQLGMYAIVDLHYVDTYEGVGEHGPFGYLDKKPQAQEFWNFVAPRFKDYPNVIFEIYNEPVQPRGTDEFKPPYDWDNWKRKMAQPLVDLIRTHAPDNLILVGGPNYCLAMSEAADNPVIDPKHDPDRIAYVTHTYPTHRHHERIARVLHSIVERVPVFVSEWGYEQGAGKPFHGTTSGFGGEFMDYVNAHRLGWTAWTYDNLWPSRMVDAKWSLLGADNDEIENEGRMGGFVHSNL